MSDTQTEAVAIVRAGLADVIDWLGQANPDYQPRHATPADLVRFEWLNPRWAETPVTTLQELPR